MNLRIIFGWTICVTLAIGAASPAFSWPPQDHPDSSSWPALFQQDLGDAEFPEGIWTSTDGVLTASEDQTIWTRRDYENFMLDLEFKNGPGANSGVIVYSSDLKNWIPNSVEIQIADDHHEKWSKAPKSWWCGAIFGHQPATESRVKKPGEWNRLTLACRGSKIAVVLNGALVNEVDLSRFTSAERNPDGSEIPPWLSRPKATLEPRGRIGLQGKHGGAAIHFRNIRITQLPD